MHHLTRQFWWAVMLVSYAGCVTTNATMLGGARPRRVVRAEDVVIYRTAAQVPGKYEEIALLHSKGPSNMTNEPLMFESMKQSAAEVGANAIILDAISEPTAGEKIVGAFLGYAAERQGKAIAIYVYSAALPSGVYPPPPQMTAQPTVQPISQPTAQPQQGLPWTGENASASADVQMRNLDREFRAGRIGIEEYRRLRKVLQPGE